jgi:hypothetical protein
MIFGDLAEFLGDAPFVLTIRGREFSFPRDVSAASGLRLQELVGQIRLARAGLLDGDTEVISEEENDALMDEMLGAEKPELLEYCTSREYQVVVATLFGLHSEGIDHAKDVWHGAGQGEAAAPNRKARRHPPKTSTRSRGSRGTSKGPAPKKPAPRGKRSSGSGS